MLADCNGDAIDADECSGVVRSATYIDDYVES